MKILCNIEGADGKGLSSLAGVEFWMGEISPLMGKKDNILYICTEEGLSATLVTGFVLNGVLAKIPKGSSSGGNPNPCGNYQGCTNHQSGCGNYQGSCGNHQASY